MVLSCGVSAFVAAFAVKTLDERAVNSRMTLAKENLHKRVAALEDDVAALRDVIREDSIQHGKAQNRMEEGYQSLMSYSPEVARKQGETVS